MIRLGCVVVGGAPRSNTVGWFLASRVASASEKDSQILARSWTRGHI
jgi:hypothetical protein